MGKTGTQVENSSIYIHDEARDGKHQQLVVMVKKRNCRNQTVA